MICLAWAWLLQCRTKSEIKRNTFSDCRMIPASLGSLTRGISRIFSQVGPAVAAPTPYPLAQAVPCLLQPPAHHWIKWHCGFSSPPPAHMPPDQAVLWLLQPPPHWIKPCCSFLSSPPHLPAARSRCTVASPVPPPPLGSEELGEIRLLLGGALFPLSAPIDIPMPQTDLRLESYGMSFSVYQSLNRIILLWIVLKVTGFHLLLNLYTAFIPYNSF